MVATTPTQSNFNGGEISERLHTRFDLNLYDIALAEMIGFGPLPEGGADACPGTIRVAAARGPCRLIPFQYSATQTYIVEASDRAARFYTNDGRIEDDAGAIELALPYDLAAIQALTWEQSYDVLYLFHPAFQTRALVRTDADAFELRRVEFDGGPFEARNKDQSIVVSATGVSGDVELVSSAPIFLPGDVGGLFQLEADDFGDIPAWEPGITVTVGQLLTWRERVYRVAGGSTRTGSVAPTHDGGIEWDGIGRGQTIDAKAAGGVQLEYLCDRFGTLRITAFVAIPRVKAPGIRGLPFTTASSYSYDGGYYDEGSGQYVPPAGAVDYQNGTWRWRFGAFSDRRGWPSCGVVWNERLVIAKGATLYGGVVGDLHNHAKYNEQGEVTADMAFIATSADPNAITALIGDDKLLMLSAGGVFALGPSNAASGVGPGNLRVDRQGNEGAAPIRPVELDGRVLFIGKSRRRALEASYGVQRDRQEAVDLSRYARHIGKPRFLALASQKDPNRLVWALRGDGSLALAAYLPEEQVLGWARRPLADGMAARSIATISDPSGELDQLWIAIEYAGSWHVARMDQWRQEGDDRDPVMLDLAAEYEGPSASRFGPVEWLAGRTIQVEADGCVYRSIVVDATGRFDIPEPAQRVTAGLPFPARLKTLRISGGSEGGPALGKARRVSRIAVDVLRARGLTIAVQGNGARDVEQLLTDSVASRGFEPDTGVVALEDQGEWDRLGQIVIERVAPLGATVRAIQPTVDISPR